MSQGLCLKLQQRRGVRGHWRQFLQSADNQALVWSRSGGVSSRGRSWFLVDHLDAAEVSPGEVRKTDPDPSHMIAEQHLFSGLGASLYFFFFQNSNNVTFAAVFCLYFKVKKKKKSKSTLFVRYAILARHTALQKLQSSQTHGAQRIINKTTISKINCFNYNKLNFKKNYNNQYIDNKQVTATLVLL